MNPRINDAALTLRITLAINFLYHGGQLLPGWFGGPGLAAALAGARMDTGLPAWPVALIIWLEFVGGFGVLFGVLTRGAVSGLLLATLCSMFGVHWQYGYAINWSMTVGRGHGVEMHALIAGVCLASLLLGAGSLSIDRALRKRFGNHGLLHYLMG